jgi:hypothetical protein
MNRRIRKLATYLQAVICLRKAAQKGHLTALVRIFTRTEREILKELLKALLERSPKAKRERLSPDERKSLRFFLHGLLRLSEESIHALASQMEKETKRQVSQLSNRGGTPCN